MKISLHTEKEEREENLSSIHYRRRRKGKENSVSRKMAGLKEEKVSEKKVRINENPSRRKGRKRARAGK